MTCKSNYIGLGKNISPFTAPYTAPYFLIKGIKINKNMVNCTRHTKIKNPSKASI